MVNLYITSPQKGTGKTTLCAGLAKYFQKNGKKVGYLKLSIGSKPDGDADFMKRIFSLTENLDDICPPLDSQNLVEKVKQAQAKVATGKDVVIIEGLPIDASAGIVEALGAKAIVIEDYTSQHVTPEYKKIGAQLLGVVFNKVPKNKLAQVQSHVSDKLSHAGVNVLGVLPEDRTLVAITIGEIAELIKGKFIDGANRSADLIENFMLGAMTIDPGPLYYNRKREKAVLVRSDRPDMQMAALETPTKCLVLVGDVQAIPAVLNRAKAKKVPVISASGDIKGMVATIENALSQTKFNQEKKLTRLGEILGQSFNFKAVPV